jgi:hypothetical protein
MRDRQKAEHHANEQAQCDQESPRSRSAHQPARSSRPVTSGNTGQVLQVTEHVHGHEAKPQDKTHLVELHQSTVPRTGPQEEKDAGREQHDGQCNHEWSEDSKRHGGRTFAPILRRSEIVPSEAPRRGRDLHENWWDQ